MSLKSEIEFCTKVLKLLDSSSVSTIFSPPLILTSFTMIYAGSDGITAEEFEKVIGKGINRREIIEYYSNFIHFCKTLNEKSEAEIKNVTSEFSKTCYKLLLSYKLFLSNNLLMNPDFINIINEKFENQLEQVDFYNKNETANKINKFVEEKTEGNIKKIVEISDIKKKLELFLVNALCFKGFWIQPFEEPKLQNFYSNNNVVREIEMISQESTCEKWNLTKGENWECIGIPYETRQSWLHILMPNKNYTLEELVKNFDSNLLLDCIKESPVHKIRATIPTFHIESDLDLENIMKQLGINEVFRGGYGIRCMSEKALIISKALHKAGIKIDQYGTYGYAAGGFGFEVQTFQEPYIFIADRPFIFFVTLVSEEIVSNLKSVLLLGTFC